MGPWGSTKLKVVTLLENSRVNGSKQKAVPKEDSIHTQTKMKVFRPVVTNGRRYSCRQSLNVKAWGRGAFVGRC